MWQENRHTRRNRTGIPSLNLIVFFCEKNFPLSAPGIHLGYRFFFTFWWMHFESCWKYILNGGKPLNDTEEAAWDKGNVSELDELTVHQANCRFTCQAFCSRKAHMQFTSGQWVLDFRQRQIKADFSSCWPSIAAAEMTTVAKRCVSCSYRAN